MQSPDRSLVDALVSDTVRCVLFGGDDREVAAPGRPAAPPLGREIPRRATAGDLERAAPSPAVPAPAPAAAAASPERSDTAEARAQRLLLRLFASRLTDEQGCEERVREGSGSALVSEPLVLQCCSRWSREALASAKAALKAFLRSVAAGDGGSADAAVSGSGNPVGGQERAGQRVTQVFETYALVKLFLLEKDERYRATKLAEARKAGGRAPRGSIAGASGAGKRSASMQHRFLVLLRVQLALYAHYFEIANGRKITHDADVRPVQSLYAHFLAHRRLLAT